MKSQYGGWRLEFWEIQLTHELVSGTCLLNTFIWVFMKYWMCLGGGVAMPRKLYSPFFDRLRVSLVPFFLRRHLVFKVREYLTHQAFAHMSCQRAVTCCDHDRCAGVWGTWPLEDSASRLLAPSPPALAFYFFPYLLALFTVSDQLHFGSKEHSLWELKPPHSFACQESKGRWPKSLESLSLIETGQAVVSWHDRKVILCDLLFFLWWIEEDYASVEGSGTAHASFVT